MIKENDQNVVMEIPPPFEERILQMLKLRPYPGELSIITSGIIFILAILNLVLEEGSIYSYSSSAFDRTIILIFWIILIFVSEGYLTIFYIIKNTYFGGRWNIWCIIGMILFGVGATFGHTLLGGKRLWIMIVMSMALQLWINIIYTQIRDSLILFRKEKFVKNYKKWMTTIIFLLLVGYIYLGYYYQDITLEVLAPSKIAEVFRNLFKQKRVLRWVLASVLGLYHAIAVVMLTKFIFSKKIKLLSGIIIELIGDLILFGLSYPLFLTVAKLGFLEIQISLIGFFFLSILNLKPEETNQTVKYIGAIAFFAFLGFLFIDKVIVRIDIVNTVPMI